MKCHQALALAAGLLAPALLPAQSSGLEFDVVSIHPSAFPSSGYAAGFRAGAATNPCAAGRPVISGTRVSFSTIGICDLIRIAYDAKSYQVVGVPPVLGFSGQDKAAPNTLPSALAEMDKDPPIFYDIEARAPGSDPPTQEQVREMLRALLAARFRLTLHRENRDLSYYALVPAKNGPKLTPAVEGCRTPMTPAVLAGCGMTMEQLARRLNANADRVVLDMTGISGRYDYAIPIDATDTDRNAAILAAIEQHLKLKLEARKGPMEVLVVDHVERPSEN